MKSHELHVAGKSIVVELHYLDHVVSKDGKLSLLDFSNVTNAETDINVLFIDAKLVIQEDLIFNGVSHAIIDKLEHGKVANDNPAINILMHIFGTNQIDAIKQLIVPTSYLDPGAKNEDVALVLVSDRSVPASRDGFFSAFGGKFRFDIVPRPGVPLPLHAKVVQAWTVHKDLPQKAAFISTNDAKTLARIALARMAIFSLNLQQKG
ncbi:MAG: hypothetical protein GYA24_11170 [Candidatus Lokiarchaeota archaeon]|nr:hypothetical protein [Candidatus Lokiarchaeota archaeon]